ncbi:MAG: hypothetical protein LBJ36_09825 [Synergistaceae bacterium]|nr:hypothetical protein [Synergistaceae bacterium]
MIFASFGSAIAGRLYDLSGSYASAMLMAGGVGIASGLCLLGIHRPNTMAD